MDSKVATYRRIRRQIPLLPALMAWRSAASQVALQQRIRETGFAWQAQPSLEGTAAWEEQGYTLTARIICDETGWDMHGVDGIGRFQTRWEPGAIEHDRFNPRICDWFVPAFADQAKALYRRACAYGDTWSYVGIDVSAYRAGVELGMASLWGIESDSGEDYLTETAFELADEAIINANQSLKNLCGCH